MNCISGISQMFYDPAKVNQMTGNLIKDKDKDGDNSLTIDELGTFEDVFNKIDKNSDGKADKDELNVAFYELQLAKLTGQLIMFRDSDGDKALNVDEAGMPQDIFSKVDKNSDGKLDADELNSAHPFSNYSKAVEIFKSAFENSGGIVNLVS